MRTMTWVDSHCDSGVCGHDTYYYGGTYYVVTTQPAPQPQPSTTTVNVNVTVEASKDTGAEGEASNEPPMTTDDHNYKAVDPPVGATVPYLSDEANEKTIGGKTYFVYDGTYYRPFASDGETIYMECYRAGYI